MFTRFFLSVLDTHNLTVGCFTLPDSRIHWSQSELWTLYSHSSGLYQMEDGHMVRGRESLHPQECCLQMLDTCGKKYRLHWVCYCMLVYLHFYWYVLHSPPPSIRLLYLIPVLWSNSDTPVAFTSLQLALSLLIHIMLARPP